MQYVLLIHAAESRFAAMRPDEVSALMQSYGDYTRELVATGHAGDCAALERTHTATTVRVREGKRIVKDGPFAETREQLGGYYTLRAETDEDALAWAAKIPDARGGTIEVRPVMEMGMPTAKSPESPKVGRETHKEYLLMIYESESARAAVPEAERKAINARYFQLTQAMRAAGQYVAGEPLVSATKARSVSVEHGARVVRDGPFAETREQLGGYYRVWARDLDEAIALAAQIPAAETGSIEVRPLRDVRPRA